MLRQIAFFLLLLRLTSITSFASNAKKDDLINLFNQFADQVNCEFVIFLSQTGSPHFNHPINCDNVNHDSLIIILKNQNLMSYKEIVNYLNDVKLKYSAKLFILNIDLIIDEYLSNVDIKVNELRSKKIEKWNNKIKPIKINYRRDLNELSSQITHDDSIVAASSSSQQSANNSKAAPSGKLVGSGDGSKEIGFFDKLWKTIKTILTKLFYLLIIILPIILVAFLFFKQKEYKDEIKKLNDIIDAKDRQINSLKKSSYSANSDQTTPSAKNNKTNVEILEAALDGIRKKFINIPKSIVGSQINIKRASWLDKINNKFEGNSRISIDEKNQFILKHIEEDLVRAFETDYYKKEQIEKLLDYQDILYSQDWLKRFRKISGQRLEEITKQKINEFKIKLPNDNLISKLELDQNIVDLKKQVELAISEEESNMDTILYSSQPVSDGYFLSEKLSDELLGQHMYKILVSAKYPDSARFQFLFDNEKAMKTAIASYSTALVPVCKLEGDNTKGDRIVPYQENTYGTLRLENDRWKVQEKLRIKIV